MATTGERLGSHSTLDSFLKAFGPLTCHLYFRSLAEHPELLTDPSPKTTDVLIAAANYAFQVNENAEETGSHLGTMILNELLGILELKNLNRLLLKLQGAETNPDLATIQQDFAQLNRIVKGVYWEMLKSGDADWNETITGYTDLRPTDLKLGQLAGNLQVLKAFLWYYHMQVSRGGFGKLVATARITEAGYSHSEFDRNGFETSSLFASFEDDPQRTNATYRSIYLTISNNPNRTRMVQVMNGRTNQEVPIPNNEYCREIFQNALIGLAELITSAQTKKKAQTKVLRHPLALE